MQRTREMAAGRPTLEIDVPWTSFWTTSAPLKLSFMPSIRSRITCLQFGGNTNVERIILQFETILALSCGALVSTAVICLLTRSHPFYGNPLAPLRSHTFFCNVHFCFAKSLPFDIVTVIKMKGYVPLK